MIVDDDEFLTKLYAKKMSESGFQAETILGSVAALEKLRGGEKPDVLLLDIVMPGMDGIELLRTIKTEKLAPTSSVIMLTNQSQSAEIEKAKELGVSGYIVKSNAVPSEVVAEVEAILKKRKT